MTREEALNNLNLPADADGQQMEKAYLRLIRRYPPEFHPERFRVIDESYRTLTSLPFLMERIFSGGVSNEIQAEAIISQISPSVPERAVETAIKEIRKVLMAKSLWSDAREG